MLQRKRNVNNYVIEKIGMLIIMLQRKRNVNNNYVIIMLEKGMLIIMLQRKRNVNNYVIEKKEC